MVTNDRGADPMRQLPKAPGSTGDQAPIDHFPGSGGGVPPVGPSLPGLSLPDAPNIHIAARDFSKQANDMAANAYKPRYAALDIGRSNANKQYKTSDAVIQGLYANLAKTDTANSAADAARYDQATKDQAAASTGLASEIGKTYDANATQQLALMKQLGIDPHANAAAITQDATNDKSAAQVSAKTNSDAQTAYLKNAKNSQGDYNSRMSGADATAGVADREKLTSQLGNVLSQYDQQQSDLAGQQSSQALDIGSQLTTQDLGVQNSNAGFQQTAYQNALSKAQAEYNAQVAGIQYQGTQAQQNWENEQKIAEAQRQADTRCTESQSNWDKTYEQQAGQQAGGQALSSGPA